MSSPMLSSLVGQLQRHHAHSAAWFNVSKQIMVALTEISKIFWRRYSSKEIILMGSACVLPATGKGWLSHWCGALFRQPPRSSPCSAPGLTAKVTSAARRREALQTYMMFMVTAIFGKEVECTFYVSGCTVYPEAAL